MSSSYKEQRRVDSENNAINSHRIMFMTTHLYANSAMKFIMLQKIEDIYAIVE